MNRLQLQTIPFPRNRATARELPAAVAASTTPTAARAALVALSVLAAGAVTAAGFLNSPVAVAAASPAPKPFGPDAPPAKAEPPAGKAAEPAPPAAPAPDRAALEEAAAKLYRDIYGAESDRIATGKDAAAKLEFAGRLAKAAEVAASEAVFADLLRRKAIEFATASPAGSELAVRLQRERLNIAPDRVAAAAELADLLAVAKPRETPVQRSERVTELVAVLRDAARTQADRGDFDGAERLLTKAKAAARQDTVGGRDLAAGIEGDEKAIAAGRKARRDYELALRVLSANPNDAEAHRTAGLHLLLHEDKIAEAAVHLVKAGGPMAELGAALADPVPAELRLADAYRGASQAVTAPEARKELGGRARAMYEGILAKEPTHKDAVRIKLILPQLPKLEAAPSPGGGGTGGSVDLLSIVDLSRQSRKRPHFSAEGKALLSVEQGPGGVVPFLYEPPEEYDLKLAVSRVSGTGTLQVGLLGREGARFSLVFDQSDQIRTPGKRTTVWLTGWAMQDTRRIEDRTNVPKSASPVLAVARTHQIVVRVRKAAVNVTVDGRNAVQFAGDLKTLGVPREWDHPQKTQLWIGTESAAFRITRAELVTVSGAGKKLDPPASGN